MAEKEIGTMRKALKGAALIAAWLVTGISLGAQTIPAFQLVTRDGASVGSDALPASGQWLLVYVVPGSAPSDRLIQSLGESWTPDHAARVVIIVGADATKAQAYLADKGGEALAGATWYADPDNAAWGAFRFQGTLGVAGVAESVIDWKIDGVIQDPSVVSPVVRAWLERGARP